ncbi:hypothetical protein BDW69DRAFT_147132 [Aspergillus filifer]
MVRRDEWLWVADTDTFTAVTLPYHFLDQSKWWFTAYKWKIGVLDGSEWPETLKDRRTKFKKTKLGEFWLPKFSIRTNITLEAILGKKTCLLSDDLPDIDKRSRRIDQIVHSVCLDVKDGGISLRAAEAFQAHDIEGYMPHLRFNTPFIFTIHPMEFDIPVLFGSYDSPPREH